MAEELGESETGEGDRTTLPIEKGFPIERVNEIAEKEGRAGRYYRPIYTMHKWWARRLGCVFRAICLYTLLDDPDEISARYPSSSREFDGEQIEAMLDGVEPSNPESLWELYNKDVTVDDKKILDPFMGGGTSLVEASRFGAEVHGRDLNPVAWFITKKELEAGQTDVEELEAAFEQVKEDIADELKSYYKTSCPSVDDHDADAMYYLWVKELDCVSCGEPVPLFNDYRVGKGRFDHKDQYSVFCPACESVTRVDSWRDESECGECGHVWTPEDGNASRGNYTCQSCGQKYGITDAIQEQGGYSTRMYAVEYYCPECDKHKGKSGGDVKGYKRVEQEDRELFQDAKAEWEESEELREYVPDEEIRYGAKTASSSVDGSDVFAHGYEKWVDMFNERQLLSLSKLLRAIDSIENQNSKEMLLLTASATLRFNSKMSPYQAGRNHIVNIFKSNSFDPPQGYAENNIWGTEYGMGPFSAIWQVTKSAIEYANSPTERYIEDDDTHETQPFDTPIGENAEVSLGDARDIGAEDEYDAVITDPPYYDNIIYSELSDFFYVWQKILLEDEYEGFDQPHTPRADSIVANPAENKGEEEFEDEIRQAFDTVHTALKDNGVLAFTYHHKDAESWGELLEALCDVGFEVSATYPVTADVQRLTKGENVEFDIIIVGRPTDERQPISWNSLRRNIVKTARKTHKTLEENRDLTSGDIGVIEMGKCFQEYSKHHNEVRRAGEIMSAKEIVDAIYGIIQSGNRGEEDVYLDLLEERNPTYSDLNKHLKRSDASEERMREMRLFQSKAKGFQLLDWHSEKRQAYVQSKVQETNGELTDLDKAHFLRYRYEQGKSTGEYLERWDLTDLQELCEGLAEATGDDTYLKMLGVDTTLDEYGGGT